jgi:hypothetical protein
MNCSTQQQISTAAEEVHMTRSCMFQSAEDCHQHIMPGHTTEGQSTCKAVLCIKEMLIDFDSGHADTYLALPGFVLRLVLLLCHTLMHTLCQLLFQLL